MQPGSRVFVEGVLASGAKDGYYLVHIPGASAPVPVFLKAVTIGPHRSYREREVDAEDSFARFPGNLRRLRHKANLTQRELADRIGVRQSAVWQWEHGVISPSLDNLQKLMGELAVGPEEFFDERA